MLQLLCEDGPTCFPVVGGISRKGCGDCFVPSHISFRPLLAHLFQMSAPEPPNPVPVDQNASGEQIPAKKPMTKAERRELQERQRAAKAAAAASGGGSKASQSQKPNAGQNQNAKPASKGGHQGNVASSSHASQIASKKANVKAGKDNEAAGHGVSSIEKSDKVADLEAQRRHNTRIFAHFAIPKKEGGIGVGIKGEIHPAIVRLGRQFADMTIVGANARCIAMLVAFKTVSLRTDRYKPVSNR
jgi:translation initiation factor eIF-2B subunit delta